MARYDSFTKIYHGPKFPQIYNEKLSIGQRVLYQFSKMPSKVIQISDDDGIELTNDQMTEMVINIAKNLSKLGLRGGDVVGFLAKNTTYVTPAMLGCFLLRTPISPVEPTFEVNQIVEIFERTRPKIVFCDHDVIDKLIEVLHVLDNQAPIVTLTESHSEAIHISEFLKPANDISDEFIHVTDDAEECALITNTSGSSGTPKLACISHAQLLHSEKFSEAESISFNFCSLYLLLTIDIMVHDLLNSQKRLITTKKFSPELLLKLIEKYKINFLFLPPPHILLLLDEPNIETADLSSITCLMTGGTCLSDKLRAKIQDKLINGVLKVVYGMTEFASTITENIEVAAISSSVGKPTTNTEIKILLDDGSIGGIGDIGEILARRPAKFLRYFDASMKTILDSDGWLHTGDMGFIDKNHEIFLMGPRTLMIRTLCLEIFPIEIEEIIKCVEGVKHVIVVGTPDSNGFEMPTALVIKDPNSDIDEDAILQATNHLPTAKQLRGGVYFIDDLPMSTSWKTLRKNAKELAIQLKFK